MWVRLPVHSRQQHLLLVGRQPRGHVGEAQEHRVADEVEEGAGSQARPLPDRLAVALPAAAAPILEGVVVVGVAHRLLQEPVALYPAPLLRPPELGANLRGEAVEQVEKGRAVPAGQCAGKGEGLAAGVSQHPGGDALGRAAAFILMHFVADQQIEEAPHSDLHVVGQGEPLGAGAVGLPQGGAAQVAGAPLA